MDGPIRDGWGWGFGWADSGGSSPPVAPHDTLFNHGTQVGGTSGLVDMPTSLGVVTLIDVAGRINGVWFWKAQDDPVVTRQVALFTTGGSPLAVGHTTAEPTGVAQWLYAAFDVPYMAAAAETVVPVADWPNASGLWTQSVGWFDTDTQHSQLGHMSASFGINGVYAQPTSGVQFPGNTSPGKANYWVDLDFEAT